MTGFILNGLSESLLSSRLFRIKAWVLQVPFLSMIFLYFFDYSNLNHSKVFYLFLYIIYSLAVSLSFSDHFRINVGPLSDHCRTNHVSFLTLYILCIYPVIFILSSFQSFILILFYLFLFGLSLFLFGLSSCLFPTQLRGSYLPIVSY